MTVPLAGVDVEETAVAGDFAGRTALITGAGRGIGRAIALGLADAGAHVTLLTRLTGGDTGAIWDVNTALAGA